MAEIMLAIGVPPRESPPPAPSGRPRGARGAHQSLPRERRRQALARCSPRSPKVSSLFATTRRAQVSVEHIVTLLRRRASRRESPADAGPVSVGPTADGPASPGLPNLPGHGHALARRSELHLRRTRNRTRRPSSRRIVRPAPAVANGSVPGAPPTGYFPMAPAAAAPVARPALSAAMLWLTISTVRPLADAPRGLPRLDARRRARPQVAPRCPCQDEVVDERRQLDSLERRERHASHDEE